MFSLFAYAAASRGLASCFLRSYFSEKRWISEAQDYREWHARLYIL